MEMKKIIRMNRIEISRSLIKSKCKLFFKEIRIFLLYKRTIANSTIHVNVESNVYGQLHWN